jgi:tRNA pseudouridine38-40 synthase
MARYKVILAYDGTEFSGSQRQVEARTVQSVVEAGLRKLDWQDKSILLAGRTDAGVHACGQVAAFDLSWNHPPDTLLRALNAVLPKDVAVRMVFQCLDDFHPRFDALWRTYRYQIFCDPIRDPLRERFTWRVWPAPDINLMRASSREFVGTYDFSSFGGSTSPEGSTIREVHSTNWWRNHESLTFEVKANAFLYHMVRRMVFVLVSIGQAKLDPGIISQVLNASHKQPMFQGLAPSRGLSLVEVGYP